MPYRPRPGNIEAQIRVVANPIRPHRLQEPTQPVGIGLPAQQPEVQQPPLRGLPRQRRRRQGGLIAEMKGGATTRAGGVSPDNRRAPEMLTLMEHRFALDTPYENDRYQVLARMRSRRFTEWFRDNHAILPTLYPARWDSEAGDWRNGQSPDRSDAIFRFRQTIRQVHYNPENPLIVVRIYWQDPEITAAWANAFIEGFNTVMGERAIADAQRKINYLKQAVDDARTVQMQNSLYRLREAQTAKTMLAEASSEYALEVIDPATAPSHPAAPAVKKITVAGLFGTAFVGSGLVIAGVLRGKIRRALRNRPSPATPAAGRPDPSP